MSEIFEVKEPGRYQLVRVAPKPEPFTSYILKDGREVTKEEFESYMTDPKPEPYAPEPGDKVVVTMLDGRSKIYATWRASVTFGSRAGFEVIAPWGKNNWWLEYDDVKSIEPDLGEQDV